MTLAVLCVALLAPATAAAADVEPNNALVQAEGPAQGGTAIAGTIGSPDDVDWYVFYVQGQQQLHVTGSASPYPECDGVRLHDTNGGNVPDNYTTAPGRSRFFISVEGQEESGCDDVSSYSFRLDPGAAIVDGPSIDDAQATGEPNESASQPAGPLQGGVAYAGSLDTSNDEDWFYFFTPSGAHQVDLSAAGPALDNCEWRLEVIGAGDDISYASPFTNRIDHITFTASDAARYLVRVSHKFDENCIPAHWQFQIDPAESVTTADPFGVDPVPVDPGSSGACRRARARVRRDRKSERSLKRKLRHAHGAKRRRLKRKLSRVRHDLHVAVGQRRLYCS
jgi:hypothetical protein